jgi:hypothetical protein
MVPVKIPQDSAKGGGRSCWKGKDLGKIQSLGVDVNFKDLDPGHHSRPDASPLFYTTAPMLLVLQCTILNTKPYYNKHLVYFLGKIV